MSRELNLLITLNLSASNTLSDDFWAGWINRQIQRVVDRTGVPNPVLRVAVTALDQEAVMVDADRLLALQKKAGLTH